MKRLKEIAERPNFKAINENIVLQEDEIAKPIKDMPHYLITNKGRVWSTARINARGFNLKGKWLKLSQSHFQPIAYLRLENGKNITSNISKLMYEAFVGKIPKNHCIYHKDKDVTNNKLDNIGICTRKELIWKYLEDPLNKTEITRELLILDVYNHTKCVNRTAKLMNSTIVTVKRIVKEHGELKVSIFHNKRFLKKG